MTRNSSSFGVSQALAVGLCVGIALSSASCGTKPPPAKCDQVTCPDGCCDSDGNCSAKNDAGVQPNSACGLQGIQCLQCAPAESCIEGSCRRPMATGGGSAQGGGTGGSSGGAVGGGGGSSGGSVGGGSG